MNVMSVPNIDCVPSTVVMIRSILDVKGLILIENSKLGKVLLLVKIVLVVGNIKFNAG
jgi:hypothetical protein